MADRVNQHDSPSWRHIVIVTDVRYWQRQTGAQQRIFALVQFLSRQSTELTTVFTAPLEDSSGNDERVLITEAGLNVISLIDDWHPAGWLGRLTWELKCIGNALLNLLKPNLLKPVRTAPTKGQSPPVPRQLAEFHSPLLQKRLNALLKLLQPEIVVVEYVTLSSLVADQKNRCDAIYVVDTHDVLSCRYEQFRGHGFDHWVELTAAEEATALRPFDLVVAIQEQEAVAFRELTDNQCSVVVAGHPVEPKICPSVPPSDAVTIGYFASGNAANRQALIWFFANVWPKVHCALPHVEFLIAGTISKTLINEPLPSKVRVIGLVDQPVDFYRAVDVVVNPIQFGTGLKIKNLEAMAFGKPLVTTTHGSTGMVDSDFGELPCCISDSAEAMADQLIQICTDQELQNRMSVESVRFVTQQLNPEKAFGPLLQRLREMVG